MSEKMCKAERLKIAADVASTLRRNVTASKRRRVQVIPRDYNGPLVDAPVIRQADLAETQEGLLFAKQIEIDVADGERPKEVICEKCGSVLKVHKNGLIPKRCPARRRRRLACPSPGCDGTMLCGLTACIKCTNRAAKARLSPDQRGEIVRRGHAKRTPEQRQAHAQRSAAHLRSISPEKRSEIAKMGAAAAKTARATLSPAARSATTKKAWETRHANGEVGQRRHACPTPGCPNETLGKTCRSCAKKISWAAWRAKRRTK